MSNSSHCCLFLTYTKIIKTEIIFFTTSRYSYDDPGGKVESDIDGPVRKKKKVGMVKEQKRDDENVKQVGYR